MTEKKLDFVHNIMYNIPNEVKFPTSTYKPVPTKNSSTPIEVVDPSWYFFHFGVSVIRIQSIISSCDFFVVGNS